MRHGFLLIDKPEGPTSHDIVAAVRRALHEQSVGHLGTLDPSAEGLLVLAVGRKALKTVELFVGLPKEYRAVITFGSVSATYDREGPIEECMRNAGVGDPDVSTIQEMIRTRFLGRIDQVPPRASAVKIGGERAYRKMRQGRSVELAARSVEISACTIVSYTYPTLTLQVSCGSGTYIRSLAHDLGQALRVGGYLFALRRTSVGDWSLEDAVTPEKCTWSDVMPLKDILSPFPKMTLNAKEYDALSHGRVIERAYEQGAIAWHEDLPVAILESKSGGVKARKVL